MAALPTPAELLPHTPPMILVDEVVQVEPDRVVCRLTLRPDSMFVEDGKVPGLVAIEYMAQAIGSIVGVKRLSRGEPIRVGFLLGTRELSLEVDEFTVGDELTVEAIRVFGEEQIGSFKCSVALRGKVVATALVNVYQGSEDGPPPGT
jgi:predicted hotdog family 3-hydroxylacyl-ACP dehydratase